MSRRAVGAATSAVAALVFVLALVLPWWKVPPQNNDVRMHITLIGGELCSTAARRCTDVAMTGAPGVRDDLFAWSGRFAFGLLLAGVAAALVTAARPGPRSRAALAVIATLAVALGATTVSIESLPIHIGTLELGSGLWLALIGGALAALTAAAPGHDHRADGGWRFGLAAGAGLLLLAAWLTLASRSWWHQAFEFSTRSRSALGIELCEADACDYVGNGREPARLLLLLGVISALAGALWVTTFGLISRTVRGVAAGPWATATAGLAAVTAVLTVIGLATLPSRAASLDPGAFVFVGACLGLTTIAVLARRRFRTAAEPSTDTDGSKPVARATAGRPTLPSLGPGAAPFPQPPPPPPPAPPMLPGYLPPMAPVVAAPPALGPRPSPPCPHCRGATLWHGKRGAWWCSTCKRAL